MAFTDPQTATYATVAKPMPRVDTGGGSSTYQFTDSGGVKYTLVLSHAFGKRTRVVARLTRDSYVADVLVPANSTAASMSATLTIDRPNVGLTPSDAQLLAKALVGWASDAALLQLANGET